MSMHQLCARPLSVLGSCFARRTQNRIRLFASSSRASEPAQSDTDKTKSKKPEPTPLSSCPEHMVLTGLNYLKDQEPILAKKDEEYPPWLWTILKPTPIPDDGPGGKGEKMRLRAANRQRIKEQNFLKTQ